MKKQVDSRTDEAKRRHAQLVGEVLWAWNDLNKILGFAFSAVLNHPHPFMGQVLWTALASDNAQRTQFLAVLDWVDDVPERVKERYRWAIKQTSDLALHRNDITHAPAGFLITERGIETTFSVSGNSMKRYVRHLETDVGLQKKMVLLREDIRRLEKYVAHVWRKQAGQKIPSPRKPKLMLRQALHEARHR